MKKYICIHGHFYQPPRENPWLEEIEVQDSAYPYRDWNERITAECYNPNSASRIQNPDQKVIDIVNNYSKISLDFGPTLLSWMQTHTSETYQAILEADKKSIEIFSGHGSAIAQVYNHMIMPLANERDKRTQVIWGIEDFKYRFNRKPEGMWLAETAVDYKSLDILAEQGIKFTILSPYQVKRTKRIKGTKWVNVEGGKIDPKMPYLCKLPSGRMINIFFYDGFISQEIAFGELLKSGKAFSERLINTFLEKDIPQLVHVATDGETYGHHQKHGDMALAYCLHYIESNHLASITVYGEYLEKFPPTYEVELIENSAWSCPHGVERWNSNCGCNTGRDGWTQEWRQPLRFALDWLRDKIIPYYEEGVKNLITDPWKLRDDYIGVILNRERNNLDTFFEKFANGLNENDKITLLKFLEMQRHTMLMYTSCGWFFDEISGLETVQVVKYAARAIQLLNELTGQNLEQEFLSLLEKAPSNIAVIKNGAGSYRMHVKSAIIDLLRVAAHYAITTIFWEAIHPGEDYTNKTRIFCYEVENDFFSKLEAGKYKFVIGKSRMRSNITQEECPVTFAVIHFGDHNINGGVRASLDINSFNLMRKELTDAFNKLNFTEIILLLDKHFGTHNYTLWHLFKDESRRIFNIILEQAKGEIEYSFHQIYENYYPIMQAMIETETPLPKALSTTIEYVLTADLKKLFENNETIDTEKLERIYQEVKKWNASIDKTTLSYVGSNRVNRLMEVFKSDPSDLDLMNEVKSSVQILVKLGIDLNLWKAQNILYEISRELLENNKQQAEKENEQARKWLELFKELENLLNIRISG